MGLPGQASQSVAGEKVLIWGAGGSVGGYAVQYSKSVGHTVIATASPRAVEQLKSLGASEVLDYKSPTILDDLRARMPFKYLYTTSGDEASQKLLAELLQPDGGKFASTLPGKEVQLPLNVERIYEFFGNVTQKDGAVFETFKNWWYQEYLGKVIADGSIQPTPFVKVAGVSHELLAFGYMQGMLTRV
jgi:NADPH:quinone reductase-like Zn-dependent oxidoreductase